MDENTGEVKTQLRQPYEYCTKYDLAISAQIMGAVPSLETPTQVLSVHCGHLPPQFYKEKYVIDMDEFSIKPSSP